MMNIRFRIKQYIQEYVQKTEEEWGYIEVTKKYECSNYDDLQNLILTLTECSVGPVKFQIEKEEVAD